MTMPTMDEIAAKRITVFEILGQQWADSLAPIFAAARVGVEIVDYCKPLGWNGWTGKELIVYAITQADAWKARAERAEADAQACREQIDDQLREIMETRKALAAAVAREKAKQAKIDALMLEYCPNEMTPEQLAEWSSHQKPSPDQPEYPSTADDEATRWRHGERTDQQGLNGPLGACIPAFSPTEGGKS